MDFSTSNRRVLIFSLVYYPQYVAGAEVAMKEITDRIAGPDLFSSPKIAGSNGVEFDMITLRLDASLPKFERIGNVNVYRVGWATASPVGDTSRKLNKYAYLFTAFFKAVSLHRTRNYSAIWSMMVSYNTFAALFFKLTHPKVKFIFTLQDGDPIPYLKRRAMPLYPFFKMFFTRADHITAISNYLADWARHMGAKCPISVIPNAVDYELFSRPSPSSELATLKNKLNKKEGEVFLITTSRLVIKNAVADIISALQYLPANVKLLILGTGDELSNLRSMLNEKSPTSRSSLEAPPLKRGNPATESPFLKGVPRACREAGDLTDQVQFLGYVAHSDMPPYLQISDIFIRPSLSEGLGNSFLEAMASGIPVIGTPVGGIPDFLKDGETGLFCEVHNPKSIAQKVEKLIKDKESRDYIVRNARDLVREKYEWGKVAGEMGQIFREVGSLGIAPRDTCGAVRGPDGPSGPRREPVESGTSPKILIATGIYPPDIGGPAQYARNLFETWRKEGHEVKVAAYRLERAFPPLVRHFLYFLKVIRKGFNADMILVLDTWSAAVPTMFACAILRKKYILRTGGDFLWESYVERTGDLVLFRDFYQTCMSELNRKERLVFKLGGDSLRKAAAVIFSTDWQRKIFEGAYRLDPKKNFIVENYIGLHTNTDSQALPPANRSFVAGTRLLRWKNLELLKDAFARAQSIVKERHLEPIDLDTGKAVYDSFVEKIKNSYAVILVSLGDISPNMIFDTIRVGTPFILTRENGITDRVKDCALFVDPKDPKDIAEKIAWLADPKSREAQAQKVRAFSFTHTWEEIGKEIINIWKRNF